MDERLEAFMGIHSSVLQKWVDKLKVTKNIHIFNQESVNILTEKSARKTKIVTDKKDFITASGCRYWLIPVNFIPQIKKDNAHVGLLYFDHSKNKIIYYEIWDDKRYYNKVKKLFMRHLDRKYGIKMTLSCVVLKGKTR